MRRVILAVILIPILTLLGCSGSSSTTTSPRPEIVRKAELMGKWQMYQIEVTLASGTEMPVVVKLTEGDVVDCFYYVEKGDNTISFQVIGNSPVYQSDLKNIIAGKPASDRFSFTATQSQGLTYTLLLRNTAEISKSGSVTVFMEIIYPGNNPIFTPMEIK